MMAFHLSALLVFFTGYSTTALVCFLVLYMTRFWAIAGGYHRYFSHRSYDTSLAFQFLLAPPYIFESTAIAKRIDHIPQIPRPAKD